MKEYCLRIKKLRENAAVSQREIAEFLGTTQQVYSRYENGLNELPLRHLIKICEFYSVSADYVLGICDKIRRIRKQ